MINLPVVTRGTVHTAPDSPAASVDRLPACIRGSQAWDPAAPRHMVSHRPGRGCIRPSVKLPPRGMLSSG